MRNIKKYFLVLLSLLLSISFSYGVELNFKVSAGINYLKLGTVNRTLEDWVQWQRENALFREWDFQGEPTKLHTGLDFVGEIMIIFNPRFSLGLGSGIIYGELTDKKTEITVKKGEVSKIGTHPTKVNAYPLNLAGYFMLPFNKKLSLYLKGSAGLIYAKYVHREGKRTLPDEEFEYFSSQMASAQGPFFEGGVGFIVKIDTHLRVFVESILRKATIKGFKGDIEEETKGFLYSFEEYDSELDFWQAKFQIFAEKPTGENYRSVEEAAVDFSGFSVKIGLIIKF